MIKALIFDFGGVIMRTRDYAGRRKWEERLGLGKWGADKLVFASSDSTNAQLGAITEEELWAIIGREQGLDAAALAEFRADFWSGDFVDGEVVGLIDRLRPRYKLGLLSNAWSSLRALLAQPEFGGLLGRFDVVLISAEEGLMKPDARIYRRAVERLGVAPGEAVFVDDIRANVEGARAAGLEGIHFKSAAETEAALRALGVTIAPQETP